MKIEHRSARRRTGAAVLVAAGLASAGLLTAAPASASGPDYVALGDSMASGPLVPDITGPLACGRSTHNYAHLLADRFAATKFTDVTCSGAATVDLTDPMDLSIGGVPAGTAPAQFDALTSATTLVTMTMGGNDVGLVGAAEDCIRINPLDAPCKDKYTAGGVDQIGQRIEAFAPKIAAAVDGIRARSPQARVLVTGYGLYMKPGGCWPTQPWLPKDADYLQSKVDQINQVISAQATAHGAEYVDVAGPSVGHDACQSSSARWVEGLIPSHSAAPLHPNAQGEAAYAGIIGDQIAGA